jgi:hypothetical protein
MESLAQIIRKNEHLPERRRQLRKIFKAVATRAILRPMERIRSRSDGVHAVTFDTVEPGGVRTGRNMTTGPEKLERLAVTLAAHFEGSCRIGPCDEIHCVSLALVGLSRITAVAAIATNAYLSMGASFIEGEDSIAFVAVNATVRILRGRLGRPAGKTAQNGTQP